MDEKSTLIQHRPVADVQLQFLIRNSPLYQPKANTAEIQKRTNPLLLRKWSHWLQ